MTTSLLSNWQHFLKRPVEGGEYKGRQGTKFFTTFLKSNLTKYTGNPSKVYTALFVIQKKKSIKNTQLEGEIKLWPSHNMEYYVSFNFLFSETF